MRIEAENLQLAITKAAEKLNCSVTNLDIKILQHPNRGLFGFFKKNAIIEANIEGKNDIKENRAAENIVTNCKNENSDKKNSKNHKNKKNKQDKKDDQNSNGNSLNGSKKSCKSEVKKDSADLGQRVQECNINKEQKKYNNSKRSDKKQSKQERLEKKSVEITQELIDSIKSDLKKLFDLSCFKIDTYEVSKFDNETIYIKLDGEDAALLIGKEGYRYKAVSYLIYNWINIKYGLNIRLEIAEFFKNQETMIASYLESIIEKVNLSGKAHTKPLDGVLVKIALEQLREKFPDKYVGIKSGKDGRFIVVNSFQKNHE